MAHAHAKQLFETTLGEVKSQRRTNYSRDKLRPKEEEEEVSRCTF